MKILNFKNYIKESSENMEELKKWAYEYAKDNHEGVNSYEDAVIELDDFFEIDFISDSEFYLYRVLEVEDKSDIDEYKLGQHYIHPNYLDRIKDKGWYESVGLNPNEDDYDNLYLVKVKAKQSDVEWYHTINNRLNFPREFEVTLKEDAKPSIEEIILIDKNTISH